MNKKIKLASILIVGVLISNSIKLSAQESKEMIFESNSNPINSTPNGFVGRIDIGVEQNNWIDSQGLDLFDNSFSTIGSYKENSDQFIVNAYLEQGQSIEMLAQSSILSSPNESNFYNLSSIVKTDELSNNYVNSEYYKNYSNTPDSLYLAVNEFVAPKTGVYQYTIDLMQNDEQSFKGYNNFAFKVFNSPNSNLSPEKPYQRVWTKEIPVFTDFSRLFTDTGIFVNDNMIDYSYVINNYQGGSFYFSTGQMKPIINSNLLNWNIKSNLYGNSIGSTSSQCNLPITSLNKSVYSTKSENYIDGSCSNDIVNTLISKEELNNIFVTPGNKDGSQVSLDLPEFWDINGDGTIDKKTEFINVNNNSKNISDLNIDNSNLKLKDSEIEVKFKTGTLAKNYIFNFDFNQDTKTDLTHTILGSDLSFIDGKYSYVFDIGNFNKSNFDINLNVLADGFENSHITFSDTYQMGDLNTFNYNTLNDVQFYNDEEFETFITNNIEFNIFNAENGISSDDVKRGWSSDIYSPLQQFGVDTSIDTWIKDDLKIQSSTKLDK